MLLKSNKRDEMSNVLFDESLDPLTGLPQRPWPAPRPDWECLSGKRSNVLSQTVLVALTDVGEVASALRTKVGQFLHAMAQHDIYCRHYEWLPRNDAVAMLSRIICRCALACRITCQAPRRLPSLP